MQIIIGIVIGVIATVIGSLIVWQIQKEIKKRQKLEIELQQAPRNLLDHIRPGVSVDQVKRILGTPYRNKNDYLTFKFSNLLVQTQLEENSVKTITLLLNDISKKNIFKIPPIDKSLGKVFLNDLINNDREIVHDFSAKHVQISIECYFGYPGLYQYYTFGIFAGPVGAFGGEIPNIEDLQNHASPRIKANYVSISKESEQGAHFNFWSMV